MKFGSTVTSIWRVMARYMRDDSFTSWSILAKDLRRTNCRAAMAAPISLRFQWWFQHSSGLKRAPRGPPDIFACKPDRYYLSPRAEFKTVPDDIHCRSDLP